MTWRFRFVKPASSFRSRYAYANVLYLAAGQVIAAVNGKSWDDVMKERIFTPLGMTTSNTRLPRFVVCPERKRQTLGKLE